MPPREPGGAGQFGPDLYASWRASSLGDVTEALEHRLLFRLAGPLDGQRVLDVGCGDGTLAMLALRNGAASAAGCDADPRMVARAALRARNDAAPAGFAVARAQALPFADNGFDVVFCVTVLAFVADADAVLREMLRVLRPGGRLVLGDLGKCSLWAVRRRIRGWLGAKLWRTARFRTAGQLVALVRQAGLTPGPVEGAIFFPPSTALAHAMAPLDSRLGGMTTVGAAFVALRAERPRQPG